VRQLHPRSTLFAAGWSLGANILVNYLAEQGRDTPLEAAVSMCNPFDLTISNRHINEVRVAGRMCVCVCVCVLLRWQHSREPVCCRTITPHPNPAHRTVHACTHKHTHNLSRATPN
jgi:hypothetical protein